MRIAFFGGSFDPPHCGHLAIARAAVQRLHLERVIFAPVGRQPLKHAASTALAPSYSDRCAMVELAIAGDPTMTLSRIDAPRADSEPNYTIETLHQLSATLNPADELYCLVGADSFLTLRQWRQATELLLTYSFIVATRPGFSLGDLARALPDSLAANLARITPDQPATSYQLFQATSPSGHLANIYLLPGLDEDISATKIRAALAHGTAGESVLVPSVVRYIRAHHLYHPTPT